MYPRLFEFNRDKKGPNDQWETHGGATSIDLIVTDEEFQKLKDAGSQKQLKDDDEGNQVVKLIRKWEAPYPQYAGPPEVAHADGTPWNVEEDGLIGNGSEVIVYVSVYDTKGYRGTRLDAVQVIEHVKYESDSEYTKGFKFPNMSQSSDSEGTPKKETKKKVTSSKFTPAIADDEIPF